MTKDEVKELLKMIKDLYPNFNLNQTVAESWELGMQYADFTKTKEKLLRYHSENKFAPIVSDIKVVQVVNAAELQRQEIQQAIEWNKKHGDPKKRKELMDRLSKLKSDLYD
ncbi:hypothetical protein [Macrococcus animalis]|uniref:hypothetical protein n=1 Tax=Macrococcus animalis TaxID=3395467 RepID=UPI0039BE820E